MKQGHGWKGHTLHGPIAVLHIVHKSPCARWPPPSSLESSFAGAHKAEALGCSGEQRGLPACRSSLLATWVTTLVAGS